MISRLSFRPRADRDIDDIASYLFEESPDAAIRFYDAVLSTATKLMRWPGSGRAWAWFARGQSPLRAFRVEGFSNYLLFYATTEDALVVVRVLHSSRDVSAILSDEDPV